MTTVRAQRLSEVTTPRPMAAPAPRDVDLTPPGPRDIPRAPIPTTLLPVREPRQAPKLTAPSVVAPEAGTPAAFDQRIIEAIAAAGPSGCMTEKLAAAVERETSGIVSIIRSLELSGRVWRSGSGRGTRWHLPPPSPAKELPPPEPAVKPEPTAATFVKPTTAPQAPTPVPPAPAPTPASRAIWMQSGPLPPRKPAARKKSSWRLLAEAIKSDKDWFVWPGATETSRASIREWRRSGLPIKHYLAADGQMVVCHRDAEVPS